MIYYALHPETGLLKIGMAKHIGVRFWGHRATYGVDLILVAFEHGYREREKELHKQFEYLHVIDENVQGKEWFIPDLDLIKHIESECCPATVYDTVKDFARGLSMRTAIRYLQKYVDEYDTGYDDSTIAAMKQFYFDCPELWMRY
jgi:hypothetical protein